MKDCVDIYWQKRIVACKDALEANNFAVYLADNSDQARQIILTDILPALSAKSVSWGDSETFFGTEVPAALRTDPDLQIIETFESGVPRAEIMERRRQALLVDLFFTGSNALTETGQLVNLDMIGNRVAGLVFGPRHVVVVVGRNKIVPDLTAAMRRVRDVAAPVNAIKHSRLKTPCQASAFCSDCKSPDRICNVWSITEKAYPKGRIKVVIINQDLGL